MRMGCSGAQEPSLRSSQQAFLETAGLMWEETWFKGLVHWPPAGKKAFSYWDGGEVTIYGEPSPC